MRCGSRFLTTPVSGFTTEVSSAVFTYAISGTHTFSNCICSSKGKKKKNAKTVLLHKNSFNINWSKLKL